MPRTLARRWHVAVRAAYCMFVALWILGCLDDTEPVATAWCIRNEAGVSALMCARIDIRYRGIKRLHCGFESAYKAQGRRKRWRRELKHTCGVIERVVLVDGPYHGPAETPLIRIVHLDFECLLIVVRHPLVAECAREYLSNEHTIEFEVRTRQT